MSTTTSPHDDPAADLVARTLRAVAAAVPVTPAGRDLDLAAATVVHLTDVEVGRSDRRRRHRRRAAVLAAAAVAAAVAGVWTHDRGDGGDPTELDVFSPSTVQLVPGWLPDDVAAADRPAAPSRRTGETGLVLDGALISSPDGTGDVLAVTVARQDGHPVGELQVAWVREAVEMPTTGPEDGDVTDPDGRGLMAIGLGSSTPTDTDSVLTRLQTGASPADAAAALPGWTAHPVPLDWLPDIAPTYGTDHRDDRRGVEVVAIAADLPTGDTLGDLLFEAQPVTVRGHRGWRSTLPEAGHDLLLWQEEPGLVGAVIGDGLTYDELQRVADELQVGPQPDDGDAGARVVAEGEVSGIDYHIDLEGPAAGSLDPSPCTTLYLDGLSNSSYCGLEDAGLPFLQIGPVERNDDVTLVWGLVGSEVHEIVPDDPAIAPTRAVPLDPDDPGGTRSVLLAVPADHAPLSLDLVDRAGMVLTGAPVDPQGDLGLWPR